ncbi:PREDICTED: serine/threonine-protein kinase Nek9-like isoform X2 [Priapulus caudatus]|uniref:non-specific serine/threonine protein kinase n=1 Tax=Priapulus caudatus TaxID=37621 RepID=A0ABM1EZU0_PRICU|nr:PREDICTED: serine/threonine-protein kinase Nek9-like isoform X2 [Priapulus caudatus]
MVLHCSSRWSMQTNPLRLVSEIVKGRYEDIGTNYSDEMKSMVSRLLFPDPGIRPDSNELLKWPLLQPTLLDAKAPPTAQRPSHQSITTTLEFDQSFHPVVASKSCEVYCWGGGRLAPYKIELFKEGNSPLQVALGPHHFAVVTVEGELYTWTSGLPSAGMAGQLGHGSTASYKAPKRVEALVGHSIKLVACGEDFTICLDTEGQLFSFGSNYHGCLAAVDGTQMPTALLPLHVDYFTSHQVEQVSCGDAHVVALTAGPRRVYAWGCGEYGRLGLGSEDDCAMPQLVPLPAHCRPRLVTAGPDRTFVVVATGRVLGCGSNEFNKLGRNSCVSGVRQQKISYDVEYLLTLDLLKPLTRWDVRQISAGNTHSAIIDEFGRLVTFGSNADGQLGMGHFRQCQGPYSVAGPLAGQVVVKVACGDGFTVAATRDNHIYSWGRGDNGQLGVSGQMVSSETGRTSLPRPIFGSLHLVVALAARHWSVIMIAEQTLHQRKFSGIGIMKKEWAKTEAAERTDLGDSGITSLLATEGADKLQLRKDAPHLSTSGTGSVPDWLIHELADAEFIPYGTEDSQSQSTFPSTNTAEVDTFQAGSKKVSCPLCGLDMVENLRQQVAELQTQNIELQAVVRQQEMRIKTLEREQV